MIMIYCPKKGKLDPGMGSPQATEYRARLAGEGEDSVEATYRESVSNGSSKTRFQNTIGDLPGH